MEEVQEFKQLTLDDYMEYKKRLTAELNNLANGFIKTGYYLKKIRDAEAYRNDGYDSIYDFAEKEYGITRTVASRFMSINDKFSDGGYSLELMEQYKGLGSSRLTEMLNLDVEDHAMITSATRIEDIRELKRFEKETPQPEATPYAELFREYFRGKEKELDAVMLLEDAKEIAEIVNPSGNRTQRYKALFMAMHEYDKGISIKALGTPAPDTMTWELFIEECRQVFKYDRDAAGGPYSQNYRDETEKEPEIPEKQQEAPKAEPTLPQDVAENETHSRQETENGMKRHDENIPDNNDKNQFDTPQTAQNRQEKRENEEITPKTETIKENTDDAQVQGSIYADEILTPTNNLDESSEKKTEVTSVLKVREGDECELVFVDGEEKRELERVRIRITYIPDEKESGIRNICCVRI